MVERGWQEGAGRQSNGDRCKEDRMGGGGGRWACAPAGVMLEASMTVWVEDEVVGVAADSHMELLGMSEDGGLDSSCAGLLWSACCMWTMPPEAAIRLHITTR